MEAAEGTPSPRHPHPVGSSPRRAEGHQMVSHADCLLNRAKTWLERLSILSFGQRHPGSVRAVRPAQAPPITLRAVPGCAGRHHGLCQRALLLR